MRGRIEGLEDKRRTEILDACEKLYQEKGFKEITLKDISVETSFSRPSIYNYFKTKEEIFLGLLTREYNLWTADLRGILGEDVLSVEEISDRIARSLEKRVYLLKISAMNLYEIEDQSSLERLMDYKVAFKEALDTMGEIIEKHFAEGIEEKKSLIQFAFFPFMYGIYPYTSPTEKQIEAMEQVNIPRKEIDIYTITKQFLEKIL